MLEFMLWFLIGYLTISVVVFFIAKGLYLSFWESIGWGLGWGYVALGLILSSWRNK